MDERTSVYNSLDNIDIDPYLDDTLTRAMLISRYLNVQGNEIQTSDRINYFYNIPYQQPSIEQNVINNIINSTFEEIQPLKNTRKLTKVEICQLDRVYPSERVVRQHMCFCGEVFKKHCSHIKLKHCGHRCHSKCAFKWFTQGSRYCPFCKRDAVTGESED